jgi:hypothetical protein
MPKKKEKKMQVMQLRPPKFKDKGNRSRVIINLKNAFGFIPEIMIIDKVPDENNKIIISAVLPPEMAERDENDEHIK